MHEIYIIYDFKYIYYKIDRSFLFYKYYFNYHFHIYRRFTKNIPKFDITDHIKFEYKF